MRWMAMAVAISFSGFVGFAADNSPPVAEPLVVYTSPASPVSIELPASDPDGDGLIYRITSLPRNGVLLGNPPELVYIPFAGFTGTDSFTYEVEDAYMEMDVGIVKVKVMEGAPPMASGFDIRVWQHGDTLVFDVGEEIELYYISGHGAEGITPLILGPQGAIPVTARVTEGENYAIFSIETRKLEPGRYMVGLSYGNVICLFTVVLEGKEVS